MWNAGLAVCLKSSGSVLTDGVSGPDRVGGDGERAESKSVLSSDPEQVFLTLQQTWNHITLMVERVTSVTLRSFGAPGTSATVTERRLENRRQELGGSDMRENKTYRGR
ncbi:hypothetical protein EYF80_020225 [Liparis tanakae]|uniref:Uncharacterized protein n=1 Tax=Liparis tanakae TaxID=230148 RepID=A0A4Z2HVD3_9TELE|nr:hypothetical protein EYF80_020225 [Liparis tanakae]